MRRRDLHLRRRDRASAEYPTKIPGADSLSAQARQIPAQPEHISLAEIIRLFDGALAPTESVSENFYEPTPIEKEPGLVQVFKEIREYVSNTLESTTIADLIS